jgi:hypothetical protein
LLYPAKSREGTWNRWCSQGMNGVRNFWNKTGRWAGITHLPIKPMSRVQLQLLFHTHRRSLRFCRLRPTLSTKLLLSPHTECIGFFHSLARVIIYWIYINLSNATQLICAVSNQSTDKTTCFDLSKSSSGRYMGKN